MLSTHHAEHGVKIIALFVHVHSVPQRAVELPGWGRTPSAALTALALQLGVAAKPPQPVRHGTTVARCVVHLEAVQGLVGRENVRAG